MQCVSLRSYYFLQHSAVFSDKKITIIIVSPTRSGDTMDSSSLSSAPSSASTEISC